MRRTRLVARRVGRIERQLAQETFARGIGRRDPFECVEIGCPRDEIVEIVFQPRAPPGDDFAEIDRPGRLRDPSESCDEVGEVGASLRGRRERLQRCEAVADRRRGDDPFRARRADSRQQLRDAKARDAIARILGEAQSARTSLICAASRNFSPPNFTNGTFRRVSSSSSAAL